LLVMIAAMHSGQGRFDRARERLLEAISLAPQLPGGAASELSAVYAGLADACLAGKIEGRRLPSAGGAGHEGNAGPGSLQAVNALVGLAAHFNSAGRLRKGSRPCAMHERASACCRRRSGRIACARSW
jgi:hypothetical protein